MPSTMSKEDEILTKEYQRYLVECGFNVSYYYPDDYPNAGQLNMVKQKIEDSVAMIAFGFKQINIGNAVYRPGTAKQKEWSNKWLSTPWSEIEVGMGVMRGIPILLVKDEAIGDGIFDKHLSECFVSTISTSVNARRFEHDKNFINWMSKINV